jgi:CheY-like chemotaxis protein
LLVEDNPVNQLLAEKLLSDWGCNISIADNGRIAVEKLAENTYDLVLMDIKMPEMDGYEATRYIRQNMGERGKIIPIIALTAHAATWEVEKCRDAGMNGYISKPFNVKELYRMISGNLNNRQGNEGQIPGQNDKVSPDHRYTDLTFLKSIAKGSAEFMNKIINSFINQTSDELKNIQAYLTQQNWAGIQSSAHKIKPSFHFVGITELKDPIANLEKYAKERVNLEAIPGLVHKVVEVCNKAIEELKQELATMNQTKTND